MTPNTATRLRSARSVATVGLCALAAALHTGPASEGDAAWLARDLEVAVRGRETVTLVVALPGGESREFTMELTGIGGGRVRGRDKGADLERTLPLSSISSVRRG